MAKPPSIVSKERCSRKGCDNINAICLNTKNKRRYCVSCARKINERYPARVVIPDSLHPHYRIFYAKRKY